MDERTKEFIELFDRAVNAYLHKNEVQEMAEKICYTHRTLQQNKMRLIVEMLRVLARMDKDGQYDLRNEATVKLATKLLAGVSENDLILPMV